MPSKHEMLTINPYIKKYILIKEHEAWPNQCYSPIDAEWRYTYSPVVKKDEATSFGVRTKIERIVLSYYL